MTATESTWTARPLDTVLRVDPAHPVFFDHPLDHVPGMLMMIGVLDCVRGAARVESISSTGLPDRSQRLRAAFTFDRLAEVDADLRVLAMPCGEDAPATSWRAEVSQGDVVIAMATVEYPAMAPVQSEAATSDPFPAAPIQPALANLVHRTRQGNVMLGTPVRTETLVRMALLNPPSDHYFARRGEHFRGAEEAIEGARQACALLWHAEYGRRSDVQLLMDAVQVDIPLATPRADAAELRWSRVSPRGSRAVQSFDMCIPQRSETPVGTLVFQTRAVTAAAYQRLRSARSRSAALPDSHS